MVQGPRTVDAMMLAEELDADWASIHVEQAPVIPETYRNLATGGSGATRDAWKYMRQEGAEAREMRPSRLVAIGRDVIQRIRRRMLHRRASA
jgi:isoquinoline 1-oxidoreductase beta subunit